MARLLSSASVSLIAVLSLTPLIKADPESAESTMSAFQFSGVVNADNVYVRSGSSENDYPVLRLNKGDSVVVVGQKMEWLKILPPPSAFCLVGKLWVDARADGTVGRVHDDAMNVNVRIGSNLNNMIATVVTQLKAGDEVKIVGSQDEYYKITPPANAFVYVNKRFVDVVKRVDVAAAGGQMQVKPAGEGAGPATVPSGETAVALPAGETGTTKTTDAGNTNVAPSPTTEPSLAAAPTTAPSAEAQAAFDSLESRFADASTKAIGDQPIDELLAGYKLIAGDKALPESMLRTADGRVKSLALRHDLYADYQKSQAAQAAYTAKQMPLEAEASEMRDRMKETEVKRYAAVGALHTSALPYNGATLYRLTDPASGRTVIYVVTADPNIKAMEGQFIGIRGEVTEDAVRKIRYIQPTAAEAVEPADVTKGSVTTGLMPPSVVSVSAAAQ